MATLNCHAVDDRSPRCENYRQQILWQHFWSINWRSSKLIVPKSQKFRTSRTPAWCSFCVYTFLFEPSKLYLPIKSRWRILTPLSTMLEMFKLLEEKNVTRKIYYTPQTHIYFSFRGKNIGSRIPVPYGIFYRWNKLVHLTLICLWKTKPTILIMQTQWWPWQRKRWTFF